MGRVKNVIPRAKFIIKPKSQNPKTPVIIQYSVDGRVATKHTKVAVYPKDWDEKTQKIKTSEPLHVQLNRALAVTQSEFNTKLIEHQGRISIYVLRDILSGKYGQKHTTKDFISFALDYSKTLFDSNKIAYSTYVNYQNRIKIFNDFLRTVLKIETLEIKNLSEEIFDKFIAWRLSERNNTEESVNKAITPLIKAATYAKNNNLTDAVFINNLKDKYITTKRVSEVKESEIKYMTEVQMQTLVDLQPTLKYQKTRDFVDLFLFAFHACGLRVSDLLILEWKNIDLENKTMLKINFKSKNTQQIPLTQSAIKILERWKSKKLNPRFVFDLLPEDFNLNNEAQLLKVKNSKNRAIITSLNEVGNKIGLPFNLSMHVARHTFAVFAINKSPESIGIISKLLGHTTTALTEQIYAKFLPSTIAEAVRENFSFSFTASK